MHIAFTSFMSHPKWDNDATFFLRSTRTTRSGFFQTALRRTRNSWVWKLPPTVYSENRHESMAILADLR